MAIFRFFKMAASAMSAYRHCHSTETVVVIVYNDTVRSIDRWEVVPLVLLDLTSPFDSIDHDCLTFILKDHFSVAGVALSWFQSLDASGNKLNVFNLFRHCRKDEISVDTVSKKTATMSKQHSTLSKESYTTCSIRQCCFDIVAVVDVG